jgi:hypothetical protein
MPVMDITLHGIPVVLDANAPKDHIVLHPEVMEKILDAAMPDTMVLYRGVGTLTSNGPMPTPPKPKTAGVIIG